MSDEGSVAGAEQTEELDVSIPLMGTRLAPPAQARIGAAIPALSDCRR